MRLVRFEVSTTPRGRLITWETAAERNLRGYEIQVRKSKPSSDRPKDSEPKSKAKGWTTVSPIILARGGGPEKRIYAWHHQDAPRNAEYRLVEVVRGDWRIPLPARATAQ